MQQYVREQRYCSKRQHTNRVFSSMDTTIVLAPGNPLRGDDGAGQVVLEALKEVEGLPGNTILHDGSGGVLLKSSGWIWGMCAEKCWICYQFVTNQEPVLLPLIVILCLNNFEVRIYEDHRLDRIFSS